LILADTINLVNYHIKHLLKVLFPHAVFWEFIIIGIQHLRCWGWY